jgi:acyl carrier protein
MSDIATRVRKVVADILHVDDAKMTEDARFVQDLGAESIKSMEMIAAFEEEFSIELNEDEALACKTIGSAIRHIEERL